jgi:GH24 family phage-related lysozyme (muramidase)
MALAAKGGSTMHRRSFLQSLAHLGTAGMLGAIAPATVGDTSALAATPDRAAKAYRRFDRLLAEALANENLLVAARTEREGHEKMVMIAQTRPRPAPSATPISERATNLIVAFEVSDQKAYVRAYQHPTWPEGASGVTIGIGYDIGYARRDWLHEDWQTVIPDAQILSLEAACGVTGRAADELLSSLRSVVVPWDAAMQEFLKWTQPRTVAETEAALPNTKLLSSDSLGALVSLVYNRGASFFDSGDRFREMRAIRQHMDAKEFGKIPAEFRAMKRLWAGKMAGLVRRRELEAVLFEAGLASVPAT